MEIVEEIDDDKYLDDEILQRKNSITNRILLTAAREGKKDVIDKCIEQSADINFVDRGGNTPLHYAIKSKNSEIVKFFVDRVKDINVENNQCRTPLDIAYTLKEKYIIEEISEKNVDKAFEILENQEDEKSDGTVNKLTFMEATFHNDYKVPLSKEDIQNILDFTYFRGKEGKLFKVIETDEDIEIEIVEFFHFQKTTTLVFQLERIHWITLILCNFSENNFKAYYIDSLGSTTSEMPNCIKEPLLNEKIEISNLKLKQHVNMHDSGIFSLKIAEIFNSFSNETEVKEKLQNLELDTKKEREIYANILMEKKRVEDKIAICLETLQNLNKNKSNVDKLNYKNANVFINFVETFALEDTFLQDTMSKIWTQVEIDQIKKKVTDLKKDYFQTYYFKPEDIKGSNSDFNLIRSARKILHKTKTIQPEDFKDFMKNSSSVSDFFKKLEQFTENIKNKINNNLEVSINDIPCHSFLSLVNKIGKQSEDDFLSVLRKFLLLIYMPENKIDQEKIIFEVTVNIISIIDKNKENVRSLSMMRNNLVHNYHKKSISKTEKKFKGIQKLHTIRSDLFKFYYSKEVHRLLSNMLLESNLEALQNEFQKQLEDFQKEINKEENNSFISGEHSKSFEYIFQESLFPESEENMNNLVDKYLKYAYMVERKTGATEVRIDYEEEEKMEYKKLTDEKKREIFEDFMKLKKTKELTRVEIQNEKEERKKLKEKLNKYGVEVSYFDRILKYHLDDGSHLDPGESIKKREKITRILSVLKQIKNDFSLSSKTIISLYEKFLELKQKGIANLMQCGSILDEELNKSKLTENQKERQKSSILSELCNFPAMETIDIMIESQKITELNTFDIIRNILSVFCNSYDKYKIKFNNIVEAFNDDTFLYYLVNLNIERTNENKIFKDKYFVFTIIKKLITMECASPYIAELLIESNDDTVIEKNDFTFLLRTLLKNKAYVKHLSKLLNMKSENFDIYGEFCNQILDTNFSIENIHDILQDHNHVDAILNKLYTKIKNIKSNHLMEYEASKLENFCNKILNKDFNIIQDYGDIKTILNKLRSKIKNVNDEQSYKIYAKKVIEFCEKNIVSIDFNAINVLDKFENNNIKSVLSDLKAKIHNEVNYGNEKYIKNLEEITQQILKQLNILTNELHYDNYYTDAIKILEISIAAGKKLFQNDDLKNILFDAEFQKQRSIIHLAIIEKDECIKKKNISKALRILLRIQNKNGKKPKSLLILAEISNAKHHLKMYDKSYESYKELYEKIGCDISSNEFRKIDNSKEYQKLMSLSNEAKKYLSITDIQTSMAYNKFCEGKRLIKRKKYEMAITNFKVALIMYKKLYSYLKESLKDTLDSKKCITQIVLNIINTKLFIGGIYINKNEFELALCFYQKALVKCILCSNYVTKIYANFQPHFKKNKLVIETVLNCIKSADKEYVRQYFDTVLPSSDTLIFLNFN